MERRKFLRGVVGRSVGGGAVRNRVSYQTRTKKNGFGGNVKLHPDECTYLRVLTYFSLPLEKK